MTEAAAPGKKRSGGAAFLRETGIMIEKERMQAAIEAAEKHWKYLHTIPEMAFEEHKTTEYIRNVCSGYPVKIIDIGMETGLVCWLDAGRDKTVALRADIDAVPTADGPHHFCGHDSHSSALLGAMDYLCGAEDLTHNVLFIFQPAEEGTRGARAMLDHGLLEKVPQRPVRIFGIHNRPEVDFGKVVVHRGPLMSEKSIFRMTFEGVAGHGSLPHKCVDPIVAAAAFINGIQTISSRNIDPFDPVICTVNSVNAGAPDIAVTADARVTGYFRSFSHEAHKRMGQRLRRLAESTAEAYECRFDLNVTHAVPAVFNGDEMHALASKAVASVLGEDAVTDSDPCLASEDFAVYGEEMPAFLYWVGSGVPGEVCPPWHDPGFHMDPRYMQSAVPVLCASALVE